MVGGKIKEDGNPRELILQNKGPFAAMVHRLEPLLYSKILKEHEENAKTGKPGTRTAIDPNKTLNYTVNDLNSLLEFLG